MSSLSSFLEMGGYGGFVWPAFGLTAAVLAESLRRLKAAQKALARLEAQSPSRRQRRTSGGAQT
jgi:heme exporter protein D